MSSYDAAWAVTIGLMLAALVGSILGLIAAVWALWRHPPVWWRKPALVAALVAILGATVSLGQIAVSML